MGAAGATVQLRWQRGVFVPENRPTPIERARVEAGADTSYLDCLDAVTAQGRQVGPYPGRNYAPAIFTEMPQAWGYRAKALRSAQERLFSAGRIEVVKVGPPSKQVSMIARKGANGDVSSQ